MRIPLLIAAAVSSSLVMTAVLSQSSSDDGGMQARKRYLLEYTMSGELILPKNFNEWIFVDSPLLPT